MKTDKIIIGKALTPFKTALGDAFGKVEADIRSALGREEKKGEKDPEQGIIMKDGDWKASAGFALTRRNGEKLQLPSDAPWAILLCFGMRINELSKAANNEMQATIPEACKIWVENHTQKKEPVTA